MNLPIIPGFFLKKEEEMIKRRLDFNGGKYENAATTSSCGSKEEEVKWEMRPGGMLVQQRSENFGASSPKLRIRVAYGALRYEIAAHSLATFGKTLYSVTLQFSRLPVVFAIAY